MIAGSSTSCHRGLRMKGYSAAAEVEMLWLVIGVLLISSTFGCPGAGFEAVTAVDGDRQVENAASANEIG